MIVDAVTSWNTDCGIAAYAEELRRYLNLTASRITLWADPRWLDPAVYLQDRVTGTVLPDVVWLNYHAGLHSRWTPELVQELAVRVPVVITYHDTYDGERSPNSERAMALAKIASRFIVHEPVTDIPEAVFWRQGIPDAVAPGTLSVERPVLGTLGFPFPWKNYDLLAAQTAEAGWSLFLIAPRATAADERRWRALNPRTRVWRDFVDAYLALQVLSACDATAFLYTCHNTGTSGAVRQGIAARRPVYALTGSRQFRDLEEPGSPIRWLDHVEDLEAALQWYTRFGRDMDPEALGIRGLADRDSWRGLAARYAEAFRAAVEGRGR